MNTKRIVITGGPGTGKSSIINELINRGYSCLEEISREIILKAREDGVEQLFLNNPLLFSELLLEGRRKQFLESYNFNVDLVFLDRGIPDILAYMDYIGDEYPQKFIDHCKNSIYDHVFILAPWQDIFVSDNERYENFGQALQIHDHLLNIYKHFNYTLLDVPFGSVNERTDFILNAINNI